VFRHFAGFKAGPRAPELSVFVTGLVIRKMPCLPANYPGEVPGTTIIARRTRLPPRWKRR
jgi:hypothetical protein